MLKCKITNGIKIKSILHIPMLIQIQKEIKN